MSETGNKVADECQAHPPRFHSRVDLDRWQAEQAQPLKGNTPNAVLDLCAIEQYCATIHEAAKVAVTASGIDLTTVVLVASSYSEAGGKPEALRFQIGDADDMATVLAEWSAELGRNVYVGLHLMRTGVCDYVSGEN